MPCPFRVSTAYRARSMRTGVAAFSRRKSPRPRETLIELIESRVNSRLLALRGGSVPAGSSLSARMPLNRPGTDGRWDNKRTGINRCYASTSSDVRRGRQVSAKPSQLCLLHFEQFVLSQIPLPTGSYRRSGDASVLSLRGSSKTRPVPG